MAPHYDRHADAAAEQNNLQEHSAGGVDHGALEDAAEALRAAEVEAVQPEPPKTTPLDPSQLDSMDIDSLRVLAKELNVHDRATITERDDLIAAIRQCLY